MMTTIHDATPAMADGIRPTMAPAAGTDYESAIALSNWAHNGTLPVVARLVGNSPWAGQPVAPNGACYLSHLLAAHRNSCPGYRGSAEAAVSAGLPIKIELVRPSDGITCDRPTLLIAVNEDGTRGMVLRNPLGAIMSDDEAEAFAFRDAGGIPDVD